MRSYLVQHKLEVDAVRVAEFSTHNIHATPTLVLVDSDATVLNFWVGRLSQETEQEVIKAILAR